MAAIGKLPDGVFIRRICESDRTGVVTCLKRGFPQRDGVYWDRGFARLAACPPVRDLPRYGYLIEAHGAVVGVLLTLYSQTGPDGIVRCNLAGLTVDRPYRPFAGKLATLALEDPDVTYTNVTPAPAMWRTLRHLGFGRFCEGQMIFAPILSSGPGRVRLYDSRSASADLLSAEERRVLTTHAALGCTALLWHDGENAEPLLLTPKAILKSRIPCRQIVYCRSTSGVGRAASALGRYLLRQGTVFCVMDATAPIRGLKGRYFADRGPKFYFGPNPPRPGDLSFTEVALFGA